MSPTACGNTVRRYRQLPALLTQLPSASPMSRAPHKSLFEGECGASTLKCCACHSPHERWGRGTVGRPDADADFSTHALRLSPAAVTGLGTLKPLTQAVIRVLVAPNQARVFPDFPRADESAQSQN